MKGLLIICAFVLGVSACNGKGLSKSDVQKFATKIYQEQNAQFANGVEAEWVDSVLINGEYRMPFWYAVNGDKPASGYPMYISMHGGGGAPAAVNDKQWSNQKRLYGVVPGIYWVPRAPTDSWNLWHQGYMEDFLLKAVTYAVEKLGADPNRIYLMGYSAGGDGTFNLAPRLADRFAAAAMMAGHPGDAVAENLRNIPFAIYMGGKDAAYNRNGLAAQWGETLDSLQQTDPKGFVHRTVIYPEKGHWMDNEDKEAIGWLAGFTRNPYPQKIVWVQDDVLATRKYNLEVENPSQGDRLVVSYDKAKNSVEIVESSYPRVTIWLNDNILNLGKPVVVTQNGRQLFKGKLESTQENIKASVANRYDPAYIFPAKVTVQL